MPALHPVSQVSLRANNDSALRHTSQRGEKWQQNRQAEIQQGRITVQVKKDKAFQGPSGFLLACVWDASVAAVPEQRACQV